MSLTDDPTRLFTARGQSYMRFVRSLGYPQGLRSYFMISPLLRSGLSILDAGCGSGIVTLALREALLARGLNPGNLHGFDLTPAMLKQFRNILRAQAIEGIELVQANVLELDTLPSSWNNYDLIVSASMLEYVPSDHFVAALSALRALLNKEGRLLLFITRKNWIMKQLVGRWWQSNTYTAKKLQDLFSHTGFSSTAFRKFPVSYYYMNFWGFVVEAHVKTSLRHGINFPPHS